MSNNDINTFLLKRPVDWSLLTNGFHIPTEFHELVYAMPGGRLNHGDKRGVKILIDGETFDARINNIAFDQTHYPGHPDLLQIRYSQGSPIARKLQSIFVEEFQYLQAARANAAPRTQVQLPEVFQSEVVFYATMFADTFVLECYANTDHQALSEQLSTISEEVFESTTFVPIEDKTAGYTFSSSLRKVRKLDRSIGDSLKQLYDYRCQMTGEKIGDQYAVEVVEAHHIRPFTESMNNDTSNIIILSPTYHRIVHAAKPTFNYHTLSFDFPNGLSEKVKLNKHLLQA